MITANFISHCKTFFIIFFIIMSPRAAISNSEIIKTLKYFEICDNQTGKLKSKFNSVWRDICATWDNQMKHFNLYFYVYQNRHNVFETYKKMKNVINFNNFTKEILSETDDIDISDLCNDSNSNSFDSFEWNTQHPCNDKKIQFKIVLSKEQWLNIKPEEKVNNRGEIYYSLKNGWTHILSELIFLQEKLPCAYSFKNQKVIHANCYATDYIVKINGFCSDHNCKAQIYGQGLFQFTNDDDISLEFVTLNTKDLLHSKKRYVSGIRKTSFKKHLKHKKADVFRSELIRKYHKYGDQIGPLVPNNNVINGVRFEAKNEEFGVKDNVWKSLTYFNFLCH
ncbi:uncharacterized protein LOC115242353 [Formica exsecta]|uniref:uncharacterized protein LOC115242353 n=1 Tax=Formica exsecta TaxID=72781 RepID=UPI0011449C94|nr:uncharacterized protein LOC115242353 [Formica exsecta]